jgi:hypothetical protein
MKTISNRLSEAPNTEPTITMTLTRYTRRISIIVATGLMGWFSECSNAVAAETIVSSLGNSGLYGNYPAGAWAGSPFQTDAQYWELSSVTIHLAPGGLSSTLAHAFLLSDNAGAPGVPVVDLGSQTVSGDVDINFVPMAPTILNPSQNYWVVVGGTEKDGRLNIEFKGLYPLTYTGVPGASMGLASCFGMSQSGSDLPSTWSLGDARDVLLFGVAGIPVVPEPGACTLILAGAITVFFRRRRFESPQGG